MRAYIALAMVLAILLASALAIQPATALNVTASPFITTDSTMFMFPVCSTGLTILEFNSLAMTSCDFETIDIDFPLFSDGFAAGPTSITSPDLSFTSNVLPFGPVNLAFPSIGQTVIGRTACERTYFFTDTFG